MAEFTFVHAADLHLDAPFRGVSDLLLSPSVYAEPTKAAEQLTRLLREGTFIALQRLTELCIQKKADFLLLAGDIYNSADSSLRARLALRDAFTRLEAHGVQIFLAHGNHDPLSEDSSVIPWPGNVTVFGRRLESHPVLRQGETLAVIHGISHAGRKEERNLATLFPHRGLPLHNPELLQVGLLHCALMELSGGHALYAPCSFSDLAATDMDYWALGHVHACRLLDRQGRTLPGFRAATDGQEFEQAFAAAPYVAYPGSLQGLHVNETGAHGCLLLKAGGRKNLTAEALSLAPVQWKTLHVEIPRESSDIALLESLLLEKLTEFSPRQSAAPGDAWPESGLTHSLQATEPPEDRRPPQPDYSPEAVIVRLILDGHSELNHELRKSGTDTLLAGHMNAELDGSGLWLRDVLVNTRPLTDLAACRERPDLAGATLRRAFCLQNNPQLLAEAAERSLSPLFQRPKLGRFLSMPKDEELALLAEEAALLCLDLLEGE
jgi:DNA repair exonuclease SbcCD nuclease subunit